jgi:protein-L-isoaspartate(D-aspartate) O-methyltransferase
MERLPALAERAQAVLSRLGYTKVSVFLGDGTKGLPAYAPFDGILVTAGGKSIPQPLLEQLKEGGYVVMPIGEDRTGHELRVGRKVQGTLHLKNLGAVYFVPLIGEYM